MKTSKKVEKMIKVFEENEFNVDLIKEGGVLCAEVETWTAKGVDMIYFLRPFTVKSFEEYVEKFDIDTEIDLHRQGELYREHFHIADSLKDFEEHHAVLKAVLAKLKDAEKPGRKK